MTKSIGAALTNINQAKIDKANKVQATADGLENAVAGMGGTRDKMSYSTWETPRILGRFELENMYRGSWVAGKIIDIPANDMTRAWRKCVFDDDTDTIHQAVEKAEKKWAVQAKFNEALKWARLYGGAVILIGTKSGMRDPSTELVPESVKKGDLKYLQVLDRWRLAPGPVLTKDITSLNFGLPEYYIVAESAVKVHWTRVIRFEGTRLPHFAWLANAMWHDPILCRVMESLMHRETATKAVATMMFEANVDVISGSNISDLLSMKDGEAKLIKRFASAALMKSFNRVLLLDSTETYEKKSNQFTNLDKIMQEFMSDVAGAADIPVTRLFGQSPAGMSATGESDMNNYYDGLSAKQEAEIRPQLDRLDEIMLRSELGSMPDDFCYEFNSLWQMSDKEKSAIMVDQANSDKVYLDAGVMHAGQIARELKERGSYMTITDEDIQLIDELSKPLDGDPADPEIGLRDPKAENPVPPALAGAVDPKTGLPITPPAEDPAKPAIPPVGTKVPQQKAK